MSFRKFTCKVSIFEYFQALYVLFDVCTIWLLGEHAIIVSLEDDTCVRRTGPGKNLSRQMFVNLFQSIKNGDPVTNLRMIFCELCWVGFVTKFTTKIIYWYCKGSLDHEHKKMGIVNFRKLIRTETMINWIKEKYRIYFIN